jgi:hypothetical protein
MRTVLLAGWIVSAGAALLPAQGDAPRVTTEAACAASLGAGLESRRTFCDVLIGATGADSVAMSVPPHTGASTLLFDLHNRFTVPVADASAAEAFARHEAIVSVVTPAGDVLGRAAVVREFRTMDDLFDRLGGGGRPGGMKGVAPGLPEPARFIIPVGVQAVGIVGSRLTVLTPANGLQTFDTPGRPVALISHLRIEYQP